MYEELVNALRICGDEPYNIIKPCKVSPWKLMRDAADVIEKLEKDLKYVLDCACHLEEENEELKKEQTQY